MDGTLESTGTITGTLSAVGTITGTLASTESISGTLTIPTYIDVDLYEGDYTVSPDFEGVTLETTNKTLTDDITVSPIQVETVSNTSGGNTVYIGGII